MLITHRVKFRELPFINCYVKEGDLAIIETQYIKLLDANWSNILSKESNSNIYRVIQIGIRAPISFLF
jgi:hypothetical protein